MTPRTQPGSSAREPETLDTLWDAMWEDLRHNATGRPTGLAIIARHRPAIEPQAREEGRRERDAERDAELLKHGQINVGTVVGYEAGLKEGRREGLATLPCPACGHGAPHHSSGGMCDGGGTECYCVRFNDPEAWGVDWAARLAPQGRDTGERPVDEVLAERGYRCPLCGEAHMPATSHTSDELRDWEVRNGR